MKVAVYIKSCPHALTVAISLAKAKVDSEVTKTKTALNLKQETYNLSDLKHCTGMIFTVGLDSDIELGGSVSVS